MFIRCLFEQFMTGFFQRFLNPFPLEFRYHAVVSRGSLSTDAVESHPKQKPSAESME